MAGNCRPDFFMGYLSAIEWMAQDNGLVAIWACRYDINRRLDLLFQKRDIIPCILGQLIQTASTQGAFLPSRQLYINGFDTHVVITVNGRTLHFLAVLLIAYTHFDGVQPIQ